VTTQINLPPVVSAKEQFGVHRAQTRGALLSNRHPAQSVKPSLKHLAVVPLHSSSPKSGEGHTRWLADCHRP
jgi:hypothetical protein